MQPQLIAQGTQLRFSRHIVDGREIMAVLGLRPGPEVGEAYRYLMELRLDEGELPREDAEARLRAWWAERG